MSESIHFKKIDKPFEKTKDDEYLVLSNSSNMTILNEIAFYIWSNSDGKTTTDLAQQIYAETLNKEEVTIEQITTDCREVFGYLLSLGLVRKDS